MVQSWLLLLSLNEQTRQHHWVRPEMDYTHKMCFFEVCSAAASGSECPEQLKSAFLKGLGQCPRIYDRYHEQKYPMTLRVTYYTSWQWDMPRESA